MEYLVPGEPKETLDRIEVYMTRANYGMSLNRTEVSANFYPPGGCLAMFLMGLYLPGLRVVVSPAFHSDPTAQGSLRYTRVTLTSTGGKAARDAERMMLEEFDAIPIEQDTA